jgi:MoaA/NifB/PqqE/SkfB family radical SAM enzyme
MGNLQDYMAGPLWRHAWARPLYSPLQWYLAKADPLVKDAIAVVKHEILRVKISTEPYLGDPSVAVTFVCNARCKFCANRYLNIHFEPRVMSQEVFERAIDEFVANGATELSMTSIIGEVLVDPGFMRKVAYARKRKLRCTLTTNGILFMKYYKELARSGLSKVTISLSDADPAHEAEQYGISLEAAKRKLEGITLFLRENSRRKRPAKVFLAFRQSRHPCDITREPLFKEWMRYSPEFLFYFRIDDWGGVVQQHHLSKYERLRTPRRYRREPCSLLTNVTILPDGTARLCGCRTNEDIMNGLVVGNIVESDLSTILTSERTRRIWKDFTKGKTPDICKKCTIY